MNYKDQGRDTFTTPEISSDLRQQQLKKIGPNFFEVFGVDC